MQNTKKTLIFATVAWCFICLAHLYWQAQGGFAVRQLISLLPQERSYTPLTDDVKGILSQKFRFVGKGCQFYAFASDDGRYILKFFKHKHLYPKEWLRTFFGSNRWTEKIIAHQNGRKAALFTSCQIGSTLLKDQTQIIALHLAKGQKEKLMTTLIDRLGLVHKVDLEQCEWLLQRRGQSLTETFSNLTLEEARPLVQKIVAMIKERCQRGIADSDPSFVFNIGFVDSEPLLIDFGRLYHNRGLTSPESTQREIDFRLHSLAFFFHHHFPHLVPLIDDPPAPAPD